jgi:hypothetical protein
VPGTFDGQGHHHVDRPCSRHAVPDADVGVPLFADEGERRLVRSAVLRTPSMARAKPRPGRRSTRRRTRCGATAGKPRRSRAADAWADGTDGTEGTERTEGARRGRKGRKKGRIGQITVCTPARRAPERALEHPLPNLEGVAARPRPQAPALFP